MQKFRGLTVLGVIAVAGCDLSTNLPTSQRVGVITVSEFGSGDSATLRAMGEFVQTGPNLQFPIPNTAAVDDNCNVFDYSGPPEENPPVKLDNLNAGTSIAVTTDKVDASMVPTVNSAGSVVYSIPSGPVPFTPGSQISFEVPGDSGGFPAQSLKTNTLVAPTLAPIERHPNGDMHLSWSPAGNPGGAVQLEFLFSSDSGLTPDKVMLCKLRDDGTHDIPKSVAHDWADSPEEAQSLSGLRWSTIIRQQQDVLMDLILQVQINPPTFVTEEVAEGDIRSGARR